MFVKEIELRDWDHFKEYFADNYGGKVEYVFRGHGDQEWELASTLTRLANNISSDMTSDFIEKKQLENFRMRIRGLRGRNPSPIDDLELWSLGQHYGLSTPLLDWTFSPYIAAYFAFEQSNSCSSGKRSIYALNKLDLMSDPQFISSNGFEFIEPMQDDNSRIVSQAGLFTKTPIGISLEDWLINHKLDKYLIKMNIENDYRLEAINDLQLMNIVGSTIYPDLHGAATTCNMWFETLSSNHESDKMSHSLIAQLFPEQTQKTKEKSAIEKL